MSLLKKLLLEQSIGAGKKIPAMEYVFYNYGAVGDYAHLKFDNVEGTALETIFANTYRYGGFSAAERHLLRDSGGSRYIFFKQEPGTTFDIYFVTDVGFQILVTAVNHESHSACIDSIDHIHLFYVKVDGYSKYQIWHMEYDGSSWGAAVRVSTLGGMDTVGNQDFPSCAVDSEDNVHVVWRGYATGDTALQVYYNKFNGVSWGTPVKLSTASNMSTGGGQLPCIAVDSLGNLHVVFCGKAAGDTNLQIYYTKFNGVSWSTPVRISTASGMESLGQYFQCIVVDLNDNLHVIWHGYATGDSQYQIYYAKFNGVSWGTPIRISTAAGMGNYEQGLNGGLTLGSDSDNHVHALWRGKATGYTDFDKVWYAEFDGSSWAAPVCLQSTGYNICPNLRWSRFP